MLGFMVQDSGLPQEWADELTGTAAKVGHIIVFPAVCFMHA